MRPPPASVSEQPGAVSVVPPAPGRSWRLLSPAVLSWILFDFATTVFSYVVLTRYFNEWIVIERGQPDAVIGLMGASVSILLVFTLPTLGALSDRIGRHKPFLTAFTLAAIGGTAALGLVDSVLVALLVAGVAIFAFNSAEAQYHPLLASVAPSERRSLVSGLGVGVGYVGAFVALYLLGSIVADGDNQAAFLPTAALYLAFALPCIVLVRDHRRTPGQVDPAPAGGGRAGNRLTLARLPLSAASQVLASVRAAWGRPHGRLLLARFLYVDAIATVIAFMTVYARRTGDFSSSELDLLIGISIGFAIVGAIAAGLLVERLGPRNVLLVTLLGVVAALLVTAVSGLSAVLWVVGPIVGVALGSVSASDRVFLLRLIPPNRRGEDFALYALVGKLSNGFGPLVLWGGTIFLLSNVLAAASTFTASRVAICVLAMAALAGAWLVRPLPNPRATDPDPVAGAARPS